MKCVCITSPFFIHFEVKKFFHHFINWSFSLFTMLRKIEDTSQKILQPFAYQLNFFFSSMSKWHRDSQSRLLLGVYLYPFSFDLKWRNFHKFSFSFIYYAQKIEETLQKYTSAFRLSIKTLINFNTSSILHIMTFQTCEGLFSLPGMVRWHGKVW